MTRLAQLTLLGLTLTAVGCRTCEDRPRPFQRLRDAFDRDDDRALNRPTDRNPDRLAAAPRPAAMSGDPCAPCAGVGYGGMAVPTSWGGGPVMGTPVISGPIYQGGGGTVMPGGAYPGPRDNELPQPGGYSQPRPTDYGRAPAPSATFTGSGR